MPSTGTFMRSSRTNLWTRTTSLSRKHSFRRGSACCLPGRIGPLWPEVGDLYGALVKYELTLAHQPSTCHQLGAMSCGPRWSEVGVFSARHMTVLLGRQVGLQKGERRVKALVILTQSLTTVRQFQKRGLCPHIWPPAMDGPLGACFCVRHPVSVSD